MNTTIPSFITVSYYSWEYLLINYNLFNSKNNFKVNWIIVDNQPYILKDQNKAYKELESKSNVFIVEGINENSQELSLHEKNSKGSAHHAYGLNIGLNYSKSNYVIILDPDFYIIRENWLNIVLDEMKSNSLAFFGASWGINKKNHSRQKWFDFPCAHFQCINLNYINKSKINFLPLKIHEHNETKFDSDTGYRIRKEVMNSEEQIKWKTLISCSKVEFFGTLENKSIKEKPRIKTKGITTDLSHMRRFINEMDFYLYNQKHFGLHLRSFPKGLSNLNLLKSNDAEYVINAIKYITSSIF